MCHSFSAAQLSKRPALKLSPKVSVRAPTLPCTRHPHNGKQASSGHPPACTPRSGGQHASGSKRKTHILHKGGRTHPSSPFCPSRLLWVPHGRERGNPPKKPSVAGGYLERHVQLAPSARAGGRGPRDCSMHTLQRQPLLLRMPLEDGEGTSYESYGKTACIRLAGTWPREFSCKPKKRQRDLQGGPALVPAAGRAAPRRRASYPTRASATSAGGSALHSKNLRPASSGALRAPF